MPSKPSPTRRRKAPDRTSTSVPPKPTEMGQKTVLVPSATGRFAVLVETLLARGHRVRAMTRQPDGDPARRLNRMGAEVVRGDYEEPESIAAAARGVDAVFAAGTAHRAGPEGELRHGENLVQAAAA